MTLGLESPGELLQKYGPTMAQLLKRQFPSLTADVIDSLVVEAIARVWTNLRQKDKENISAGNLFVLICKAARNRAIDQLRYMPHVMFTEPRLLDRSIASPEKVSEEAPSELATDLRHAISKLDSLDRQILEAAMSPPIAGDWARELAVRLIQEEKKEEWSDHFYKQKLNRLCGKLRVRKLRAINQLRLAMQKNGHSISNSLKGKS